MSFLFFFNTVVASNLATSNLATSNLATFNLGSFSLGSFSLGSFSLATFNSISSNLLILNKLDGFNNDLGAFNLATFNSTGSILVDFTLVNSSFAGFYLVGFDFDFDNKLLFANAGLFSNTSSSHLASRFFLQGPGSLLFTGYSFNYYVRSTLLLSYFKPHHFSCQVHFADNLPGLRRILPLSNLAMSGFSNSYLHHYISFVPSLQLHYSFGHNPFVSHTLQSSCLPLDSLGTACLPSFSLPDQVTIPSTFPSLSSQDDNSNGGIFFHFSLPKLRLSSFPFALYISRPSSLFPSSPTSNPLESLNAPALKPFDFNRSFYSQNLPSFVGLLGSSLPSCNFNSTYPSVEPIKSVGDSTSSISHFTSISDPLSTCELSSLHHFLNLRSRTASFFSFLDSFFLIDSPFLDSLPWDSFSLKQNPFCLPSLLSQLHPSSADFSLFDNEQFLANNSFYPFGNQQSCLYEEQFSLQQDLFHPFNHNCSSYQQHFPLNQAHFLLGEEHFLANNSIFTSNISFPSTFSHQLQHCPTFLASLFHASAFKASFKVSLKPTFKPYHFLSVNFGNFASSPNFDNFFSFSHSTQLDIYHHLDKSYCCPSANLHFSQFNNSSILSDYFCYLSHLAMQNQVCNNIHFSNLSNLTMLNCVTFGDYFCNLSNLATHNYVFSSYLFSNSANLVMQSDAFSSHYFCKSNNLVMQNDVIFSDYFCKSSFLAIQNHVFSSHFFCYLRLSNLHNNVFLCNFFSNSSSLAIYNRVFFNYYFCNFTYFTSLKSCSNEANLHNRSSYLTAFLAKYSTHFLNSPSLKTLLHKHSRSFYSSKLTKTSNNLSKKASSLRSHYRIKMSFEGKVDSKFAISLARNYLLQQFPNAILFAACHQNTDHTHIHVLLFARDVDGKKLHFSNSNYKKLDIGWAKLYARVFGEHKLEQHIQKKALSRAWKRDKMMGIERDKPYRISVNSRHDCSKSYNVNDNPSDLFDLHRPVDNLVNHLAGASFVKNVTFLTKNIYDVDKSSLFIHSNFVKNVTFQTKNIYDIDKNADRNLSFNSTYLHNIDRNDRLNFSFPSDNDAFIADKHLIVWGDKLSFSDKQQPLFDKNPVFSTKQQPFSTKQPDFFDTFSDHKLGFFDSFLDKQPDVFDNKLVFWNNKPLAFATCSSFNAVLDNKERLQLQPSINFFADNNQHFLDHKLSFWDNKPLELATCSSFNAVLNNKEHLQFQPSINFADNFADKSFSFNCSVIDKTSVSHSSFLDKDFVSNELVVDKVPVSHSSFVDTDSLSNRPHFDKVALIDKDLAHLRPSHNLTQHHYPTLNQTHNSFSYHRYQDLIDSFDRDYFRCVAEREIGERDFADKELADRKIVDGDFDHASIETDRDFDEPDR
ncbi:MAG: hypothetical protein WAQ98_09675 [Blastocatellia bacterium]